MGGEWRWTTRLRGWQWTVRQRLESNGQIDSSGQRLDGDEQLDRTSMDGAMIP